MFPEYFEVQLLFLFISSTSKYPPIVSGPSLHPNSPFIWWHLCPLLWDRDKNSQVKLVWLSLVSGACSFLFWRLYTDRSLTANPSKIYHSSLMTIYKNHNAESRRCWFKSAAFIKRIIFGGFPILKQIRNIFPTYIKMRTKSFLI